ncbi:hypothetical protein KFE25_011792 [Diacronema lutheri]|uniref:Cyclic nucleotide-binding domain-containing protein n=1 Tax=Diacronema lutheri TaxID=2081491 RepID=A0A8J5X3W4_DIALT|nr:hypothetical protein KFE25_011792 [Diacronema lutheri]
MVGAVFGLASAARGLKGVRPWGGAPRCACSALIRPSLMARPAARTTAAALAACRALRPRAGGVLAPALAPASAARPRAAVRAFSTAASNGGPAGDEQDAWERLLRLLARMRRGAYDYRWAIAANVACVLQLVQWSMDDVVWLRTLSCLANLVYCACNVNMGAWAYVPWDVTYIGVNLAMIVRALRERSAHGLEEASVLSAPEHARAYATFLAHSLTRREAHMLLHGSGVAVRVLEPGQLLRVRGGGGAAGALLPPPAGGRNAAPGGGADADADECVCVVLDGALSAHIGGAAVGTLEPGDWVGHVPLLLARTAGTRAPASTAVPPAARGATPAQADAGGAAAAPAAAAAAAVGGGPLVTTLTALEPSRVLYWRRAALAECLGAHAEIRRGLHAVWNRELARRLRARAPEPSHGARAQLRARHEYAEIVHALVSRGSLSAEQLAHLHAVREELGVGEEEHALATAHLARTGAVAPAVIHALLTASPSDGGAWLVASAGGGGLP